jgi:FixJ family two-component response regulator
VLSERSLVAVVDDDPAFGNSIRRLLKSLGHSVALFSSAAEFLAAPGFGATTCLIADVHMPAMTGIELYKHLIDTGHFIPTILVTAYPKDEDRKYMLAKGVECYLRKPFEEAELIGCLQRAFARGRVARGAP